MKFVPVTREEYDAAEAAVTDDRYDYTIVEYQKFVVKNYKAWISKLEARSAKGAQE